MDVIYNGPNPLQYGSAPSGTVYLFTPGERVKVEKKDNQFFKNMSASPGSNFEIFSKVKQVVAQVTDQVPGDGEGILDKVKDLLDDGELNDSVKGGEK